MKNKIKVSSIIVSVSVLSFALFAQAQEVTVTSAPLQVAVPTSEPVQQEQSGIPADMARGLGAPDQQGAKPPVMQAKIMAVTTGDKKPGFEPVLNIDPKGHILVRGTLMSVTGTTLTVKAWGVTFTVDASKVPSSNAPDMNIASFTVGDFVGVSGNITADAPQNITAEVVRDRSIVPTKQAKDIAKDTKSITATQAQVTNVAQQVAKPPMQQGQQGVQGVKPTGVMNINVDTTNKPPMPPVGTKPPMPQGAPVQQGQGQKPVMVPTQGKGNSGSSNSGSGKQTTPPALPPQGLPAPVVQ